MRSWVLAVMIVVAACGSSRGASHDAGAGGTGGKPASANGHSRDPGGAGRVDPGGLVHLADGGLRDGGVLDGGQVNDADASTRLGDGGNVSSAPTGADAGDAGGPTTTSDAAVEAGNDSGAPAMNACGGTGPLVCPAQYDGTEVTCALNSKCWPLLSVSCPIGCTPNGGGASWFTCDGDSKLVCGRCKCP